MLIFAADKQNESLTKPYRNDCSASGALTESGILKTKRLPKVCFIETSTISLCHKRVSNAHVFFTWALLE